MYPPAGFYLLPERILLKVAGAQKQKTPNKIQEPVTGS